MIRCCGRITVYSGVLGPNLLPSLIFLKVEKVFHKGTEKDIDSYSAFFDNEHLKSTGLGDYLKEKGVTDLYIVGLATDYCVKYSVLDAIHLGFKAHVILDACRGVNLQADDSEKAVAAMRQAGAEVIFTQG